MDAVASEDLRRDKSGARGLLCGCGSFRNPFWAEDGKLFYEGLVYNEEKGKWSPSKTSPPQTPAQPKLIKDAASHYEELYVHRGKTGPTEEIALEFHGVTKEQSFEELVLSQLWLYLPAP
jgi:hypothetical protein